MRRNGTRYGDKYSNGYSSDSYTFAGIGGLGMDLYVDRTSSDLENTDATGYGFDFGDFINLYYQKQSGPDGNYTLQYRYGI